jgi:hypothetical protein
MRKFEFKVEIKAISREKAQERLALMLKMMDIGTFIESIVNIIKEPIEPKKSEKSEENLNEKE